MARKSHLITNFTGTIDFLTFYKLRGREDLVVRKKGGPSKEQFEKLASFEKTRKNTSEFGGRSAGAQWINQTMLPLKSLADHTYIGKMNSILKPIQEMDTVNPVGQRSVKITTNPSVLNGFSLNKQYNFDHFVRTGLDVNATKENFSAQVNIPELRNGINFYTHYKHPVYAFILSLGMVPDFTYSEYGYNCRNGKELPEPVWQRSAWFPVRAGSPAITMELQYPGLSASHVESATMILSIGICFGSLVGANEFEQVKYAGAAKILVAK